MKKADLQPGALVQFEDGFTMHFAIVTYVDANSVRTFWSYSTTEVTHSLCENDEFYKNSCWSVVE